MKLADVKKVPAKTGSRRCLWCQRSEWKPETTPGFDPKAKNRPTRGGGWTLLVFPPTPPFGERVDAVHDACWGLANDEAKLDMRMGKKPKRPRLPQAPRPLKPQRDPPRYVHATVTMSDVMPDGRACVCCDNYGRFNEYRVKHYQPKNITANDRDKIFVIDWPAFGIVGAHTDYAHAECWLSLGDKARKNRTRRAVESGESSGPLFETRGGA